MVDSVAVKPVAGTGTKAIVIEKVGGEYYPRYKLSIGVDGEATLVGDDNPLPIKSTADDINRFSCLKASIDEMVVQMKILNKYMAEGFDNEITEEDVI